ncbi:hypothetical protein [Sagittula sp. SSi028]|uniref:hypothetical protein n=1 Tax=Sagittula sp. SSi028 TaxID=3400636 RepID=UPI003AF5E9D9
MSVSEWEEYKKNCRDQVGTPGVHADSSPGCHIGATETAKDMDFSAEPKPIGGTRAGRAQNRRVEINLKKWDW